MTILEKSVNSSQSVQLTRSAENLVANMRMVQEEMSKIEDSEQPAFNSSKGIRIDENKVVKVPIAQLSMAQNQAAQQQQKNAVSLMDGNKKYRELNMSEQHLVSNDSSIGFEDIVDREGKEEKVY